MHDSDSDDNAPWNFRSYNRHLLGCERCGWWKAWQTDSESYSYEAKNGPQDTSIEHTTQEGLAVGSLCNLDLTDLSIPTKEIRDYLVAKYHDRFSVAPKIFEEVVASVFRDLGYSALVTGKSGDDGIDVILTKGSSQVGVQVKRYRNSIDVEQIRSLAGALVLNGLTEGVFVTTSSYQSGVPTTAGRFESKGYRIELLDAAKFYDALGIAQRQSERGWKIEELSQHFNHLTFLEATTIDRLHSGQEIERPATLGPSPSPGHGWKVTPRRHQISSKIT